MTITESAILRPIPEFDGVRDVWPRGKRLDATREAAQNPESGRRCPLDLSCRVKQSGGSPQQ